jgi:hypothetical protein
MASFANIAGEADPRVPLPDSKIQQKSNDDLTIVEPAYPGASLIGRQARLHDMMCYAQQQRQIENGSPGDAGYPIPAMVEKHITRQPLPPPENAVDVLELTPDQAERANARRALKQASVREVQCSPHFSADYLTEGPIAVGGDLFLNHDW